MADDYKDLNLDRATLDQHIIAFLESNAYTLDGMIQVSESKKRIVFGAVGSEFATVDLFLNKTGTTTIHWKLGKNHSIGELLAIHLKGTINPENLDNVNYALLGITAEAINTILEVITESGQIKVETSFENEHLKRTVLRNQIHQDTLTVTHYRRTRNLQIQGRPLSCYRELIFMLTDLLDLKGLEKVLYRKDESSAEIVRKEVAEDYLKSFFPGSYDHLPDQLKRLLVSSCCVKLASPTLPDYCLLLYPDLRSLEGALKLTMMDFGMSVGDSENGFGTFFDVKNEACTLRSEYEDSIDNATLVTALNNGYSFFRKHRNTLFHMEEFSGSSRMVDTLDKAIGLSKDAYAAIHGLYIAKK